METNPNINRLLEMLDNPEAYSEQEICNIINSDDETRRAYQLMVAAKQGYIHKHQGQPTDVESAWQKFSAEHNERTLSAQNHSTHISLHPSFLKIAASFIGVLFITGIAFAAIHFVHRSGSVPAPSHDGREKAGALITNSNDSIPSLEEAEAAPVIFENVPLDTMLMEMADYYHFSVEFKREEARQLRFHFVWKPSESLDRVLERLSNFEAVNIEKSDTIIIVE